MKRLLYRVMSNRYVQLLINHPQTADTLAFFFVFKIQHLF